MNPEHIEPIIPRTEAGKRIVGKELACKFCQEQARIFLEDNRYVVRCPVCLSEYYLKLQHV